MAGSFGFEAENYEVSVAVGERVLLPAVRATDDETLIISDGFSCREQVADLTGRGALHIAQVLQMALRGETGRTIEGPVEADHQALGQWKPEPSTAAIASVVAGVGVVAGLGLAWPGP
jgi:hypothetical protein